jgi:hypothetical protein
MYHLATLMYVNELLSPVVSKSLHCNHASLFRCFFNISCASALLRRFPAMRGAPMDHFQTMMKTVQPTAVK